MELSRNLTFSFLLHAALLIAALTFISGRDAIKGILPAHLEVVLMTETAPHSQLKPIQALSVASIKRKAVPVPTIALPLSNETVPRGVHKLSDATKKDTSPPPYNNTGVADSDRSHVVGFIDNSLVSGGNNVAPVSGYSEVQSPARSVEGRERGHTDELAAIRAAIERAKKYPPTAKRRGIEGTATVEFSIDSKGMPENIKIVTSSDSEVLDMSALSTITSAAPFPVDVRIIKVPISFRLEKED